ncbi:MULTISPECIES: leucine-rich repeat protein [Gordonibacter]|uniref:Leucine-rich repeat protein n=2 Tax=Gordonibacter TaxID=644652 RepID=A0ABT7DQ98_9ACTN|nr:leucine-rich repeat protein [Gordonibacter sp. KGMB12511]MDJ1651711.1 leucine-rich repeat protein [Gordonibacter sp. KGMB12511]
MIFSKDYSHLLLIPEGKEGAVTIPGSTKFIPAQALSLCHLGTSLSFGDGSTAFASYDRMLFSKNMKTLVACPPAYGKAVVLPSETEAIGEYALAGCKDLASITVLGNVQSIDPTAFADEVKASAVVALPAGEDFETRKSIWESADFQHFAEPAQPGATTNSDASNETSGLAYTLLDDYTLSVSWQGKDDPEANLEVPASAEINGVPYRVSTIAENSFANRGSLTSVKLPSTIATINNAAFAGCANLSTIEFPNTLRAIGEHAFEATSLKNVWLPTSIETIGSRAFASCSSLERVVALNTSEVASDTLAGCTNVSIYVPTGSEDFWNPGLPSDNNHLMSYGISLSEEPLTIEAGQEADLLEGGNLQAPDPVETSFSYAAAPLSVDAGYVSAKKAGTTDVTTVLSLEGVELARAARTVEVAPSPEGEADIAILNSEVPLPSAYLAGADTQISVDSPLNVTFGQDAPYDVAEGKAPESMKSFASFRNNMDYPVQLAQVECTSQFLSTVLLPNSGAAVNNVLDQKIFSLYPEGAEEKAVHFGYNSSVNNKIPDDPSAFTILPNTLSSFIFRLNLTNDKTLADAKVNPGVLKGAITSLDLASVVCTFERSSFYLKDSTGRCYTLAEVKAHAEDISKNEKASPYWNQYEAYLNDDASYTCQTVWKGTPYDVRIIGINHDELSEPAADDCKTAGLTFQFVNLLNTPYSMNSLLVEDSATNAGGWGASELRANMNPGKDNPFYGSDTDAIWGQVPKDLQDSIAVVKKYYNTTWDSKDDSTVAISSDKLFIASYYEHTGSVYTGNNGWLHAQPWLVCEGKQYAYWSGKVERNTGENTYLKKVKQVNATGSIPSSGDTWWQRTVDMGNPEDFLRVDSSGSPSAGSNASGRYDVCPCFCL